MHQNIPKGGLKVMHFNTEVLTLRLNWIRLVFNDNDNKWKTVFQQSALDIEVRDLFPSRGCVSTFVLYVP